MADRREINIFVNVPMSTSQVSATDPTTFEPEVFRDSTLFLCTLLKDDGTAYTLTTGTTWRAGVDRSYLSTHDDFATADDDDFNAAGDWASVDPDNGLISFRLDCNTTEMKDLLQHQDGMQLWLQVFHTVPGQDERCTFHIPIYVKNSTTETGTPSTVTSSDSFITTASAAATYIPIAGGTMTGDLISTTTTITATGTTPTAGFQFGIDGSGNLIVTDTSGNTTILHYA